MPFMLPFGLQVEIGCCTQKGAFGFVGDGTSSFCVPYIIIIYLEGSWLRLLLLLLKLHPVLVRLP